MSKDLVSMKDIQQMLDDVPNPTNVEIRKLLAVQGYILQSLGVQLLQQTQEQKKMRDKRPTINLARSCLQDARKALEAAHRTTDDE